MLVSIMCVHESERKEREVKRKRERRREGDVKYFSTGIRVKMSLEATVVNILHCRLVGR